MNQTLAGVLISVVLVAMCVFVHFKALRRGATFVARLHANTRQSMMMIMAIIFMAHIIEIILFAVAYWMMMPMGLGELVGAHTSTPSDFAFCSMSLSSIMRRRTLSLMRTSMLGGNWWF